MKINQILENLNTLFPNPKCELEYRQDYEFLLAIVMSAQTTDKRVNMVNRTLFQKYPTLTTLAEASLEDIEEIIKPIGTYHKKSIFIKEIATRLKEDNLDHIPNDRKYIESLPGVGRKTANVFLSNIYDEPAIAVDTHVSRVSKRLGLAKESDDVLTIEKKLMKKIPKESWGRVHHQLVLFGRYKCKSQNPLCNDCPFVKICKYNNKKINSK